MIIAANGIAVPLGRGEFFGIDRRVWDVMCGQGLSAAVAYLILART